MEISVFPYDSLSRLSLLGVAALSADDSPSSVSPLPGVTEKGLFFHTKKSYKLAYSSNYSSIIVPVVENNYQLFMTERLILMGAKTFVRTFKEDETDLSLTDDPKNTNKWQIPVYSLDDSEGT